MKRRRYILLTSLATALLMAFSACTEDETIGGDDSLLPDGQYPPQIGNVTIMAQSSEEPWTCVVENTTDGSSSVWETSDKIGVRLDGGFEYWPGPVTFTSKGQYSVTVDESNNVTLSPIGIEGEEIYWKNTRGLFGMYLYPSDSKYYYGGGVMAWYPAEDGVAQLGDQSDRLAYILEGKMGNFPSGFDFFYYTDNIPLVFNHMLSKVWVKLTGSRASEVNNVEVYGYTSCTHGEVNYTTSTAPYRTISTENTQQGWITMHNATYGTETYWEANLVPGEIGNQTTQPFVRLNGTTEVPINTLTTLVAGNLHTVTVTVSAWPSDATQITSSDAITSNDDYYVSGNLTSAINITGDSPHIYLYNANVSIGSGPAIKITGGNPTIHVVGNINTVQCTGSSSGQEGAGIYVASGSSVTRQGSSHNDKLTARAARDGAGIGSYDNSGTNTSCGDIEIGNVTVYASAASYNTSTTGIGSRQYCGTIEIENAVYTYGTEQMSFYAPDIGSKIFLPDITITGSDIHAFRSAYNTSSSTADWIGQGCDPSSSYQGNSIQGTITNTTVYKNTYNNLGASYQEIITGESQMFE